MRTFLVGLLALAALASPAAAAETSTSTNWAGYAVMRAGVRFSRVSAAWTIPTVDCSAGETQWSATWVGLGGYDDDSPALEQIGTEADCDRAGRAHYSSWYELVPDVSHGTRLRARPGDEVSASVTVFGRRVRLRLSNRTTGKAFTRTLNASAIDVTSAEWILEAPSACGGTTADDSCQIMPLADFGSLRLSEARALTSGGHSGAISDSAWDAVQIHMRAGGGRFGPRDPSAGATTGALSASGRAFTVRYSAD
jgi:hypothetical protein